MADSWEEWLAQQQFAPQLAPGTGAYSEGFGDYALPAPSATGTSRGTAPYYGFRGNSLGSARGPESTEPQYPYAPSGTGRDSHVSEYGYQAGASRGGDYSGNQGLSPIPDFSQFPSAGANYQQQQGLDYFPFGGMLGAVQQTGYGGLFPSPFQSAGFVPRPMNADDMRMSEPIDLPAGDSEETPNQYTYTTKGKMGPPPQQYRPPVRYEDISSQGGGSRFFNNSGLETRNSPVGQAHQKFQEERAGRIESRKKAMQEQMAAQQKWQQQMQQMALQQMQLQQARNMAAMMGYGLPRQQPNLGQLVAMMQMQQQQNPAQPLPNEQAMMYGS